MRVLIEAAVESLDDALAAEAGGARRLELCADLDSGGTTPERSVIASVIERVRVPVVVMVRDRPGDHVYTRDELDRMRRDVALALVLGAAGVVVGALTSARRIDVPAMRELMGAAYGLPVTFHRAIDETRDVLASIDQLRSLGVARVLSSGGAPVALDGSVTLAAMIERAGPALTVVAGGGVRATNVVELVRRTGVREVHLRCGGDSARIAAVAEALAHAG
ncbi:MAG TPA: copper homeostasis protein CutC [Gemmatimonadaceae bacterium]|nr:copper homeostasis protein CutC [Gemmatimonadaceae bacterium]